MSDRFKAAIAGLLSAVAAVAAGELAAGLVPTGRSLIVAVGDATIDRVPGPVKDFAIQVFGTADKLALVIGIVAVLALGGALLGVFARRRFWLGVAGIGLLGVVGAAAALDNTPDPGPLTVVPAAAAVLAGSASLWLLLRRAQPNAPGAADDSRQMDRRAFLRTGGLIAVAAVAAGSVGRWLQQQAGAVASRASLTLRPAADPLPPIPPGADLEVEGLAPFVTPNEDFYRIDTALQVPRITVEQWRLRVFGMVDRELEFTFDDLLGRELVEADVTLTCVSNEVGGGLIGNARWLGVRLDDVLAEAGVSPQATQVVGRSVDDFTAGFPVSAATDGRNALIAVGMNGEPLPLEHGFPVRLVVPGLYGYVSATKWLTEIEVTTFEAFDAYWIPRGWAVEGPIKTQSRIDTPRSLARLSPGRVPVAGVAWAQTRGIAGVEVQIDEEPWQPAELAAPVNDDTWRQWLYQWDATPGQHRLRVRATDGGGETQTEERAAPIPDGASGWHELLVNVVS